jgi:hypothetical protein
VRESEKANDISTARTTKPSASFFLPVIPSEVCDSLATAQKTKEKSKDICKAWKG